MEFGRAQSIANIDWTLPSGHPVDFVEGEPDKKFQLYVGCPMWANAKWLGSLYPRGTHSRDFLKIYASNFNSIEHNGSFYHLPSIEQVEKWCAVLPQGFSFCPKLPRALSHENVDSKILQDTVSVFQRFSDKLGLPFLQFPPDFTIQKGQVFKNIVASINSRIPLAVEFRHSSWFQNGRIHPRVLSYLREKKISTVITDTPGRRDVLHSDLSTAEVMVRFLATDDPKVDHHRMSLWHQKILEWQDLGVRDIYFFPHQPDNKTSPELAQAFLEICGDSLNCPLIAPDLTGGERQQGFPGF